MELSLHTSTQDFALDISALSKSSQKILYTNLHDHTVRTAVFVFCFLIQFWSYSHATSSSPSIFSFEWKAVAKNCNQEWRKDLKSFLANHFSSQDDTVQVLSLPREEIQVPIALPLSRENLRLGQLSGISYMEVYVTCSLTLRGAVHKA